MTGGEDSQKQGRFPTDWDILQDADVDDQVTDDFTPVSESTDPPPTITVLASSWADAVAVLGVCTAALVGLNILGHNDLITALPWAFTLGMAWWVVSAAILVMIRQGTPGMLLAGVVFTDRVAPKRLAVVIGTAALCALLVGLPGVFGARRSPLALAAASEIESIPAA